MAFRGVNVQLSQQSDTMADRGSNTTSGETLVGFPIPVTSAQSPFRLMGFLRQIFFVQDFPGLVPIVTGVNNQSIVGYTWGPDALNAGDAIIFSNNL
jgi:hypothetical protein